MVTVLRALRLAAIVVWGGGIVFFAFVEAPIAFHQLPDAHEAGMVVGVSLQALHRIGLIAGFVFLIATIALWLKSEPRVRNVLVQEIALIVLMMAITGYLQFRLIPAMEQDRIAAGGTITAADTVNQARVRFERRHVQSEWLEGVVLFSGFAIVLMMASEPRTDTIRRV